MVLGLSKLFVIFAFICGLVWYATKNWHDAAILMGIFAGVTMVWRFFTN